MHFSLCLVWLMTAVIAVTTQSTQGILDLVKRRLPDNVDDFEFRLTGNETYPISTAIREINDEYTVSSTPDGKILVEGNSPIALASG
jgi:alpha-N-acetylglucosaminidase